jgi:hypothetical protein
MVRILHYRIRSAVFGKAFDPGVVAAARKVRARALSGGAGASGALAVGRDASEFTQPLDPETKARLVAGRTPDETHARHLEWLSPWDATTPTSACSRRSRARSCGGHRRPAISPICS